MKMELIRAKAKELGLVKLPSKKVELVRAIQIAEGNTPCFCSGVDNCQYTDCCFRDDCQK